MKRQPGGAGLIELMELWK